ncbi:Thiol:disulfide interchange protein DsbD [uncultured archaeon]|nr:Thiol:disulfide interchange protein DsbD [uncultured archaeon]
MKTKKLLTILVLILIIAFAYGSYNIALSKFTLSDKNNSYLGGIKFYRSDSGLQKGFLEAQQQKKPVMVYFWAIWCQYCAGFQTNTLGNPQVKQILENDYVLVAMDLDVDRDVSGRYGVSYPPYLIFMDPNGNILQRIPGAVGPDYLLPIVTQVRDTVRSK